MRLYPVNHLLTHRSRATAGRQERFHEVSFVANPTKHARSLLWGDVASSRPGHIPRILRWAQFEEKNGHHFVKGTGDLQVHFEGKNDEQGHP